MTLVRSECNFTLTDLEIKAESVYLVLRTVLMWATSLKTDLNDYLRAELRGITSVKSTGMIVLASVDVQIKSKIPDLDL